MMKGLSKIIWSGSPGADAVASTFFLGNAITGKMKQHSDRRALFGDTHAVPPNGPARRPFRQAQRILIKMPNWLGDAVMSLPAVEYLRNLFPHAWMACLVKQSIADLLRNNDALNAVVAYEHGSGVSALRRKARTIRELRRESLDLALLLTNSFESALWMALARIPRRVGYRTDGRAFLLTHPVRPGTSPGHQILYYLDLCKALGEARLPAAPRVRVPSHDQEWAEDFLSSIGFGRDDLIIGLCPGAAYGPAKRWPPGRFIGVTMKICESHPAKFAVFGGKEDVEPCEMVADGIGPAAVNLCGKTTLRELTALLHKCTLVISNDSGAMHLAAAVGTHVIAIFGSTDPTRTAPPENCTIMKKDVPCSPCFKRECPTDFRCMTSISVEEVSRKVSELLSSFASGGSRGNRPRGHRTFRSPNGPAAPSRSERRTAGHS